MTNRHDGQGRRREARTLREVGPLPNLSTVIADQLREQILSGELAPNSRLPAESDLALDLGVSRTAVREAVRTLASLGLLSVRQGHGISVSPPSDAAFAEALTLMLVRSDLTVGDLVAARAQIEIDLYSAAAEQATDAQLERLSTAVDVFRTAVGEHRWSDAEVAHTEVHLSLLAAVGIRAFDLLLRPMEQVILLSSRPPDQAARLWEVDVHAAIVAAARTRDREALRAAITAHYQVMETDEYRAQRNTLVREAPGVREFLVQVLYKGQTPALSQLVAGTSSALAGRRRRTRRRQPAAGGTNP